MMRTRAMVVQTAADLLLERGVAAVTIEAVVQRSGVARSTIYRHWPTRGDVVAAAFTHLMPPSHEPPERGDVRQRLRAVVLPKAEEMSSHQYVALLPSLLNEAARDPELRKVHAQFVNLQQAPLSRVLTEAIDAGELPENLDVDEACAELLGPVLFLRVIIGRQIDPGFAPRLIDAFVSRHGAKGN
ncbi:TetR family transcriptional regulator [Mycobacterium antarcticum]|nr:TetR family transcriptional regulator [Mycolicibacterium sp. TUM20983]